jgi:hypothetical protein
VVVKFSGAPLSVLSATGASMIVVSPVESVVLEASDLEVLTIVRALELFLAFETRNPAALTTSSAEIERANARRRGISPISISNNSAMWTQMAYNHCMKKYMAAVVVSVLLFSPFVYVKAFDRGLPFGGYVTFSLACTCPPFGIMIAYAPLFLGSSIPSVGNLLFPVGAKLYAYGLLGVPTTWNLGAFTPGGNCNMIDPAAAADADPCGPPLTVPTLGTIKYMGTSLPGASPR